MASFFLDAHGAQKRWSLKHYWFGYFHHHRILFPRRWLCTWLWFPRWWWHFWLLCFFSPATSPGIPGSGGFVFPPPFATPSTSRVLSLGGSTIPRAAAIFSNSCQAFWFIYKPNFSNHYISLESICRSGRTGDINLLNLIHVFLGWPLFSVLPTFSKENLINLLSL